MSKLISDILQAKEPDFSKLIYDYEFLAGRPGVDIKLANEIRSIQRNTAEKLGLDSLDTTDRELYYALRTKAKNDAEKLSSLLSINFSDKPNLMIAKIIKFVSPLFSGRQIWTVKNSSLRKLLKKDPPKKLLKIIGARSIDSVLKKENPSLILALAKKVDPSYEKKWLTNFSKLSTTDFNLRRVEFIPLKPKLLNKLSKAGHKNISLIQPIYETGVIIIPIPERRLQSDGLLFLTLILEAMRNIIMYSAYFKYVSTQPNFGKRLSDVLQNGIYNGTKNYIDFGWPALHNLIEQKPAMYSQRFQPAVQPDDFLLPSLSFLATRLPELKFWDGQTYCISMGPAGLVSHNLLDVLINEYNSLNEPRSFNFYAQNHLWNTLYSRYLLHEPIRKKIIKLD